jgi:hypothetical protein
MARLGNQDVRLHTMIFSGLPEATFQAIAALAASSSISSAANTTCRMWPNCLQAR